MSPNTRLAPEEHHLLHQLEAALIKARAQGNRAAWRQARQAVVRAAWQQTHPPALRTALRRLSWRMVGWRLYNPSDLIRA